jgi:hypothetical protein
MNTGELTATLRQSYNLLAETTLTHQIRENAGGIANGPPHMWLPFLDTYRTMCLAPQPEFLRLLEQAGDLPITA